jgi:hypothetical protein
LWCGEAFHRLGVHSSQVSTLPNASHPSSMASASEPHPWSSRCLCQCTSHHFIFLSVPLFIQIFCVCVEGNSVSRGLCWFIPGVSEGYHVMLRAYLFGLPKVSQTHLELVATRWAAAQ